jgi:hypothetical protein
MADIPVKSKIDVDEAQAIRDELLAPAYKRLEALGADMPEHGQQVTFAKNHVRMAFMELGFGMALTNGLDPLANKVQKG